jgi:hypothetical protein
MPILYDILHHILAGQSFQDINTGSLTTNTTASSDLHSNLKTELRASSRKPMIKALLASQFSPSTCAPTAWMHRTNLEVSNNLICEHLMIFRSNHLRRRRHWQLLSDCQLRTGFGFGHLGTQRRFSINCRKEAARKLGSGHRERW